MTDRLLARVTRRHVTLGIAAVLGTRPFAAASAEASPGSGPLPAGLCLVFVEDKACVYCRKWLEEVGTTYGETPVGRVAPLARRPMGDSGLTGFVRLQYTPTFILARDGREVDRKVGYAGAQDFWSGLAEMLAKAGPLPEPDGSGRGRSLNDSRDT